MCASRTFGLMIVCGVVFTVYTQEITRPRENTTTLSSSITDEIRESQETTTNASVYNIITQVPTIPAVSTSNELSNLTTSTPSTTISSTTEELTEIAFTTRPELTTAPITQEHKIDKCPELSTIPHLDNLTQDEFVNHLTDGCRYDRLVMPILVERPLDVFLQIDLTHIESADHLQLKAHIFVQMLYRDIRLNYIKLSPSRGNLVGEEMLRNKIWVPHIIIQNERDSSLMGLSKKDISVQINQTGYIIYSYRMTTTFYCWMNLKKFPFDYQICDIKWVSWSYNSTNLQLKWEPSRPFLVASNLHLTEFVLEEKWAENDTIPPSFETGKSAGNYSCVIFKFKLRREVGYYIMDYFLPSILLVCMSWVTFWLQADASPPRVTLGASTMLSFITLNGGLTKNLPKVSYIKASEIWFIACTSFIFFSLAEFAFVNVIWRRRKKVELKKQNSKHILKGALTPSLARKQLRKAESMNTLYKTRSCSSLDNDADHKNTQMNYLTVHSFPCTLNVPKITTHSQDDLVSNEDSITTVTVPDETFKLPSPPAWTTMTPQEVAIWIDKKSRIVFPVAFLIFNLFYWVFVYIM